MKKVLYAILLLAEFFIGLLLMTLVWSVTLYIPCVIIGVVWAAMMIWQLILLKRTTDAAKKRRIKRNIVLVMLIPTGVFVCMLVWFIVGFTLMT